MKVKVTLKWLPVRDQPAMTATKIGNVHGGDINNVAALEATVLRAAVDAGIAKRGRSGETWICRAVKGPDGEILETQFGRRFDVRLIGYDPVKLHVHISRNWQSES